MNRLWGDWGITVEAQGEITGLMNYFFTNLLIDLPMALQLFQRVVSIRPYFMNKII